VLKRSILLASAAALSLSGPAHAESLVDALTAAYNSNPVLRSERANLRAIDEQAAQARAQGRPQITATGSYEWAETTQERAATPQIPFAVPRTTLETGTYDTSVIAEQPVFRGLRTLNAKRQANAAIEAGRANLLSVEQQVLLDAVTAYSDVLRDESVVGLRENNVAVLSRQLQASRDRFEVGEITRTDVAQSEARLAGARAELISAKADLEASRAAFRRVVGFTPGTLEPLPPLPDLPATEDDAQARADRGNPAILGARANERSSRRAVDVAKGALLPSLSARARYAYSREPLLTDGLNEQTAVGGVLNVPLFQGGLNHSNVRQAKQLNNRDRMQIVQADRQVDEQVRTAWERLTAARAVIESAREQVRANEIAFDGVEQEALVGSRTTLDVLDAEQELLNSRVALVQAERDEYVAGFTLLGSVGELTAERLQLPVELYDPTDNTKRAKRSWVGLGVNDE